MSPHTVREHKTRRRRSCTETAHVLKRPGPVLLHGQCDSSHLSAYTSCEQRRMPSAAPTGPLFKGVDVATKNSDNSSSSWGETWQTFWRFVRPELVIPGRFRSQKTRRLPNLWPQPPSRFETSRIIRQLCRPQSTLAAPHLPCVRKGKCGMSRPVEPDTAYTWPEEVPHTTCTG